MHNLQLDYIDLYLIHQPYGDCYGSWRAMEELYEQGKIRAIGVSNFTPDRLLDLTLHNKVVPAVNQIQRNPFQQKEADLKFMKEQNVLPEAWGPLARAGDDVLSNEVLKKIANNHKKSVSQVILRWHVQCGVIAIPKTSNKNRMKENIDIFNFKLSDEEMKEISKLNTTSPDHYPHREIEAVKQINGFQFPFHGN